MGKRIPLEELSRSDLIKKLDEIFSKYIRLYWSNNDGFCTCITCGNRIFHTYITCGHFVSRSVFFLRWEEDNVRPQCMFPCNGNMDSRRTATYQLELIDDLGQERVNEILRIASSKKEWLVEKTWYIDKINYYTKEVEKLLLKKPSKFYT